MRQLLLLSLLFIGLPYYLYAQSKMQPIWVDQFNKIKVKAEILDEYLPNAAIGYDSELVQGREEIYKVILNLKSKIKSFERYRYIGRDIGNQGHVMEIGILDNKSLDARYVSLTGWRKTEDGYFKETEVILKSDDVSLEYDEQIDLRRDQWMIHSNAHDPEKLVNEVYAKRTRYFSSGKLSSNILEIIDRYSYMKKPNWQIELNPVKTIQISDSIAFEIGTYQSTGKGQYMLIWEKSENEEWKIIYDFNF